MGIKNTARFEAIFAVAAVGSFALAATLILLYYAVN